MSETALYLSIYSSILATTVFVWRIFEFYSDRIGKFNLRAETLTVFPVYHDNRIGDEYFIQIRLTVTNVSKNARHIKQPMFEMDKGEKGKKIFSLLSFQDTQSYPKKLEPGEVFEYTVLKEDLCRNIEGKGAKKVRFIVLDTHSSKFKSKWVEL